jgi:uncharacterized protein (DUF1800 family)
MKPADSQPTHSRRELFDRVKDRTAAALQPGTGRPTSRHRMGRASHMRRPGKGQAGATAKSLPTPPSAAIIALNRLGYGPRATEIAAFNALGGNDQQRLTAWVDQQLNPASINDSTCDAKLAAAGYETLNKSLAQLWQDHVESSPPWHVRIQPYYEVERATLLRAVWSKRQLLEILTDFWHNHFNVYAPDSWTAPVWAHWDRVVIRGNALGNFRTMLGQVAQHPAMLYYLDNYTSSSAGPNENWARELFELHTLGADHYMGVMRQSDVPVGPGGVPVAYVDDDVFEATRCFTGWTFDFDTGLFEYRTDWHDHFQKWVLGTYIPANQPALSDGNVVLDNVAFHPGTARHIATKLAKRLIGDNPDPAVIGDAAAVFEAESASPDQLAQVVRTIVLHPSFLTTWGDKIKRPLEILASAMRAADGRFSFALDDDDTGTLLWRYDQVGQPLFAWRAPNGFPDHKDDWQSATPRVMGWRLMNWLIDVRNDNDVYRLNVIDQTPSSVRTANEIANFWIGRILGRPMPAAERYEIVEFMAQGHNPDFDLPLDTDEDTRDRLRSMVGLIFMSPSFLWR